MFCQSSVLGTQTAVLIYWILGFCVLVFADVWKIQVESEVKALVRSCVVLPCSFTYPGPVQPSSRTRGVWHNKKKWDEYVFHTDPTRIAENFKERTRLVGSLGELNCSLEIDDVRNRDSGPFCFRVELQTSDNERYSFVDNCVTLEMTEEAAPELHSDDSVQEGHPAVFKCSVRHTCPSHQPRLTWSHKGKEMVTYKDIGHGNWEVESILTFTPTKDDNHTYITCTVQYHGLLREYEATRPVIVKEQATLDHILNLILIPVLSVVGTVLLFGGLCFFFGQLIERKRIKNLQSRNDYRFQSVENNSETNGRQRRQLRRSSLRISYF